MIPGHLVDIAECNSSFDDNDAWLEPSDKGAFGRWEPARSGCSS
jgi:hypothetical protein